MTVENYTNRELGILLEDIKNQMSEMKQENITSHANIDQRLQYTNGRLKKLELWKAFLVGAWAVLSMATPVAWYLILNTMSGYSDKIDLRIEKKIKESIGEAIEANNRKYFEKE